MDCPFLLCSRFNLLIQNHINQITTWSSKIFLFTVSLWNGWSNIKEKLRLLLDNNLFIHCNCTEFYLIYCANSVLVTIYANKFKHEKISKRKFTEICHFFWRLGELMLKFKSVAILNLLLYGQPLWYDTALVNKLVACVYLYSSAS